MSKLVFIYQISKRGIPKVPPDEACAKFGYDLGKSMASESPFPMPVRIKGKWGFIDQTGTLIIDAQFSMASPFQEGLAAIGIGGGYDSSRKEMLNAHQGFIDQRGTIVIPAIDQSVCSFSEGLARIIRGARFEYIAKENEYYLTGGSYGFIEKNGAECIPPQFDLALDFCEGRALVCQSQRYGFIDCQGKKVVPPQFGLSRGYSEGLAVVSVLSSEIPVTISVGDDSDSNWLKRFLYGKSEKKKTVVRRDWLQGYIDLNGNFAIPPSFGSGMDFSEGLAAISTGSRESYHQAIIDKTGHEVAQLPKGCSFCSKISHGLLAASIFSAPSMRAGWLNTQGAWGIEPSFDFTFEFSNGLYPSSHLHV